MIPTTTEPLPSLGEDYKYRSSCAIGNIRFKKSNEDEAKKTVPLATNRSARIRRSYSSDHLPPRTPTSSATRKQASSSRSPQHPTRASSSRRLGENHKRNDPLSSQSEHVGFTARKVPVRNYDRNRISSTENPAGRVTGRPRVPSSGGGTKRRPGVDPLSRSDHVQRKPTLIHRPHNSPTESLAEKLPSTSSVQDTTLELLDLIKRRRRRQAACLHQGGTSIKPSKAIQRHRSLGSLTESAPRTTDVATNAIWSPPPSKQPPKSIQRRRFMGSATESLSRTTADATSVILSPPPTKQPPKPIQGHRYMIFETASPPRTAANTTPTATSPPPPSMQQPKRVDVDNSDSSDSDEESSQNSPKSALNFPKEGGGRKSRSVGLSPQIVLLYPKPTEKEKERMRLENAQKQQEVNRMKVEMEQMQQRLAEIEQQKKQDLAQMKQAQEVRKAKMKALAKSKLAEHLENELELHLLAMEVEKKRMVALQEELEEEQEELKSTKAEWKEANTGLLEENEQLQAANDELFRMYKHLTKWIRKKTRHNDKLVKAEAKLVKILKGSIVLIVEAKLSKTYRKWMYRCAKAVNASDMYDFELDGDIQHIVQECENECNKEVIPMVDVEEWIAQQQQDDAEEEDPMFEFLQQLQQEQAKDADQNLRPMDKRSDDENEEEEEEDDASEKEFQEDMEDLDRSMRVYEQVLGDISVKLDATQMSTLYENKQMLLTIFRFLDTDKSGDIDADEFSFGIELLNKRLPEESHFQEHEELFRLLDVDGNGTIDIREFERIFVDH
eukprot:scaffold2962_cov126-Cylindrotheca_fusiformis.AAC.6